jgi:hypothetical protein
MPVLRIKIVALEGYNVFELALGYYTRETVDGRL